MKQLEEAIKVNELIKEYEFQPKLIDKRKTHALKAAKLVCDFIEKGYTETSIVRKFGIKKNWFVAKRKWIEIKDLVYDAKEDYDAYWMEELKKAAREGIMKSVKGYNTTVSKRKVAQDGEGNQILILEEEQKEIHVPANAFAINSALFNVDPDNFQQNPDGRHGDSRNKDIDPIEWVK